MLTADSMNTLVGLTRQTHKNDAGQEKTLSDHQKKRQHDPKIIIECQIVTHVSENIIV